MNALEVIPRVSKEFEAIFGRESGGLVSTYRCEDADIRVVAMGACLGTIKDTVDELREQGVKIGVVGIKCYRPIPMQAVREALKGAKKVVVIERAFAVGSGGILDFDISEALRCQTLERYCVVAGLGGRPITKKSLHDCFAKAIEGTLGGLTFMDLDEELVERQLAREKATWKTGPLPELMMRDAVCRDQEQNR